MKLTCKTNIGAAAAAKDTTRYAVDGVCVEVVNGEPWLAATDGRILAVVRAKVEGEISSVSPGQIIPRDTFASQDEATVETPVKFPDWKGIIPMKHSPVRWITLNAQLLLNLAKALNTREGDPTVMLGIPEADNRPFVVLPARDDVDGYGLLMPINVTSDPLQTHGSDKWQRVRDQLAPPPPPAPPAAPSPPTPTAKSKSKRGRK